MDTTAAEIACGSCDGRMRVAESGNVTCPHCGIELTVSPDAIAPTAAAEPARQITSQRIIAACLVFIVAIVCWEAYAGWKWEGEIDARVEGVELAEDIIHKSRVREAIATGQPLPTRRSARDIENELRGEDNPYSFFR